MKIETTVKWNDDGDICLVSDLVSSEDSSRIETELIRTKDKAVREALIALGWTPPKEYVVTTQKELVNRETKV